MTSTAPDIPQVKIHGVDDLRLGNVPFPNCGPNDVLVRVEQCGICGSDLGYLAMGGLMGPDTPMPIGHELWGLVDQLGVNVDHVAVGDKVVVQPLCNGNLIGNGGQEGGFSPYLLVRNAALDSGCVVKIPASIPAQYGALVEPLAVAQHSINRIDARPEDKAVIFGAGPIGIGILYILRQRGLKDIVVVDLSEKRLQLAASVGAHVIRGDRTDLAKFLIETHGSADFFGLPTPGSTLYFEVTGVASVFRSILDLAGPGSRVCLTGLHKQEVSVNLMMLLAKEVSVIPAMGYGDEFFEVLAMLETGNLDPTQMISHHFPLTEIHAAFKMASDPEKAIKVMVDCQM